MKNNNESNLILWLFILAVGLLLVYFGMSGLGLLPELHRSTSVPSGPMYMLTVVLGAVPRI